MPRKRDAAEAKFVWMHKLTCKREEYSDENDRATLIHSPTDSLSIEITSMQRASAIDNISRQFASSYTDHNDSPFPLCTIMGCKKQGDQIFHSISSEQLSASEDHSFQCSSLQEVDSLESFPEGRAALSTKRTLSSNEVNHEILSPSVQLLHEIHLERGSSSPYYDVITSNCKPDDQLSQDGSDNRHFHSMNQNEIAFYRQKIRYEAIKKELFEDSTLATIDQDTDEEYETEYLYGDEFLATSDAFGKVGCQAAALWSCIPHMSKFFVPSLQEGELADDGSVPEENSDDASCSSNSDDLSHRNGYNQKGSIHMFDIQNSRFDYCKKSSNDSFQMEDSIKSLEHEESSYSGSCTDQSHIYLMMTNARQGRLTINEFNSDMAKERRLTISCRQNALHPAMSVDMDTMPQNRISWQSATVTSECNKSNSPAQSWCVHNPLVTSTIPKATLRWMRHFQNPFQTAELRETEIDFVQKRWLLLISQALDGDTSSFTASSNKKERCEAAQEALQRIGKKR